MSRLAEWSRNARLRANEVLSAYPDRRSAVMPLLYIAALERGSVDEGAQRDVAELTGLTAAQVQSVASFYTMYKRHGVGEYLVSVCTSISCFLLGADDVLGAIIDETSTPDGETSEDNVFSIEHVECIGSCGGAPAVQVNYELVEGITEEKARELCRWLYGSRPKIVLSDEMQQLFGGTCSFDWGPAEESGAISAVPSLEAYGSAGRESQQP